MVSLLCPLSLILGQGAGRWEDRVASKGWGTGPPLWPPVPEGLLCSIPLICVLALKCSMGWQHGGVGGRLHSFKDVR